MDKISIRKDENHRIVVIIYDSNELPIYDDRIWAHCEEVNSPIDVKILHGVPENEN